MDKFLYVHDFPICLSIKPFVQKNFYKKSQCIKPEKCILL